MKHSLESENCSILIVFLLSIFIAGKVLPLKSVSSPLSTGKLGEHRDCHITLLSSTKSRSRPTAQRAVAVCPELQMNIPESFAYSLSCVLWRSLCWNHTILVIDTVQLPGRAKTEICRSSTAAVPSACLAVGFRYF